MTAQLASDCIASKVTAQWLRADLFVSDDMATLHVDSVSFELLAELDGRLPVRKRKAKAA